jgi:hypothetical protein
VAGTWPWMLCYALWSIVFIVLFHFIYIPI